MTLHKSLQRYGCRRLPRSWILIVRDRIYGVHVHPTVSDLLDTCAYLNANLRIGHHMIHESFEDRIA